MVSIRSLLTALLVAAGLTLLSPVPAMACSCVGGSVRSHAERAEVVLRGTLVAVDGPAAGRIQSSGDPVTYTFDVHEVFEGSSSSTSEIVSAATGASCGLEGMKEGREYVVFAAPGSGMPSGKGDELGANLCGGTGRATPALVEAVERVLGPGAAPSDDGAGERSADDPPARAEAMPT